MDRYPERIRLLLRENALVELKIGRTNEAIGQLDRALSLYPNDPVAHYYRGRAYAAKAGNADELQHALAAYLTATQVDAGFAEAYRELAMTYSKLGDLDRASEARQTYLSLPGKMAFFPVTGLSGLGIGPVPAVRPGRPNFVHSETASGRRMCLPRSDDPSSSRTLVYRSKTVPKKLTGIPSQKNQRLPPHLTALGWTPSAACVS